MKLLTTPPILSLITISTQIFKRGLLAPKKRLLLTYLIAMIGILGTSGISLYFFLIKNLNQQLDKELLTLVQAAAPSLDIIKLEGSKHLDREVPWRNLFSQQEYSLEWYDPEGNLLAREGNQFPDSPLFKTVKPSRFDQEFSVFQRLGKMQTVTISVYADNPDGIDPILEGYIRASESTYEIEAIIGKFRLGLSLGGFTAILLVGVGSIYFTQEALTPMVQGVNRIKRITSDVSHHLRTPLTRISIATEILLSKKDKIQPDEVKKLNIINTSADQLKRLVEEVLFLVRTDITSNPKERVSLKPLLQDMIEQFEMVAQTKGIDFRTQLSSRVFIIGDSVKLTRLFTNLLENAFQYTEEGGQVFFSMRLSQCNVVISIQDTGMGIETRDLPFIFQGFWRSEMAQNVYPEGFGLGLTIAYAIVQQHKGKIIVDSHGKAGTSIKVKLPLA